MERIILLTPEKASFLLILLRLKTRLKDKRHFVVYKAQICQTKTVAVYEKTGY